MVRRGGHAEAPSAPPLCVGQGSMVHVGHTPSLVYFVSVEAVHASRLALNKAFLRCAVKHGDTDAPPLPAGHPPVTLHHDFLVEFLRQDALEMKDFAFSWPKTDNVGEVYRRKLSNGRTE